MTEKEKYEGIFSRPDKYRQYGHSFHGRDALPILKDMAPKTAVDIGCGWNQFIKTARTTIPSLQAIGVDFACPGADLTCGATSLPFARKSIDVLTSFDMLEHLLPTEVDAALAEFARVSHAFIFSISYVASVNKWKGEGLHPTVQSEQWWMDRIRMAGGSPVKRGKYITGAWKNRPVEPNERVILVGNGPSVTMRGERGNWINGHDLVIRFNSYAIAGFEPYVGTRTSLWSTFGRGTRPTDKDERPETIIFTHGEKPQGLPFEVKHAFGIPRHFTNELRKNVQEMTTRTGEAKERILATSGLTVLLWLLGEVGLKKAVLVGFDHFSKTETGKHHYWMPNSFGKPKEHDGEAERRILAPYIEAGRVQQL